MCILHVVLNTCTTYSKIFFFTGIRIGVPRLGMVLPLVRTGSVSESNIIIGLLKIVRTESGTGTGTAVRVLQY